MTVCTPHSYAGPRACPYCERDVARQQLAESEAKCKALQTECEGWATELAEAQKRIEAYEANLAVAEQAAASAITKLGEARKRIEELEVEVAFRKSQAEDNENAWQCEKQKRRDVEKIRDALKLALETQLTNDGAGSSPYARSQPSDACEIETWKARVDLDDQAAEQYAAVKADLDGANQQLAAVRRGYDSILATSEDMLAIRGEDCTVSLRATVVDLQEFIGALLAPSQGEGGGGNG